MGIVERQELLLVPAAGGCLDGGFAGVGRNPLEGAYEPCGGQGGRRGAGRSAWNRERVIDKSYSLDFLNLEAGRVG
jgi:hypothetical protein